MSALFDILKFTGFFYTKKKKKFVYFLTGCGRTNPLSLTRTKKKVIEKNKLCACSCLDRSSNWQIVFQTFHFSNEFDEEANVLCIKISTTTTTKIEGTFLFFPFGNGFPHCPD